jgi:hypothetical protein
MARGKTSKQNGGANPGFEATLWVSDVSPGCHLERSEGTQQFSPRSHEEHQDNIATARPSPRDAAVVCGESLRASFFRSGIETDLGDELRQAEGAWAANADSFHRDLQNIVIG